MDRILQINVPIQAKASLAVLSAQLCFSGWHVVAAIIFSGETDPLVFILYRLFLTTVLMQLLVKAYNMSTFIDPADHKRFCAAGMLSFMNILFATLALTFIAPSRFSIFQPCIPCIVTALSMLFKLEKIVSLKLVGIALAVAGAFIAELWKMGPSDESKELNVPLGVFFATTQVFSMAGLQIVVKPLLNKYDTTVVSAMYFVVSTFAIMLLVLCRIDIIPPNDFIFNGDSMSWLALLYVVIFATLYSFTAINWGGKHLPPTVTTVFFTFQPVGTIILSATLLGATVTIPEILGGFLIICGLLVTSFAQSQMRNAQLPTSRLSPEPRELKTQAEPAILREDFSEIEFKPRSRSVGSISSNTYNPLTAPPPTGGGILNTSGLGGPSGSTSATGTGTGSSAGVIGGMGAGTGVVVRYQDDESAFAPNNQQATRRGSIDHEYYSEDSDASVDSYDAGKGKNMHQSGLSTVNGDINMVGV